MKRNRIIISVIAAFCVGCILTWLVFSWYLKSVFTMMIIGNEQHEIVSAYMPLRLIQKGKKDSLQELYTSQLKMALRSYREQKMMLSFPSNQTDELVVKAEELLKAMERQNTEPSSGGDSSTRVDVDPEPPQK